MLHVSIQNVQYYTTISKNVQRLFAGIQRVGRAGLGAINRLQPFKCRLYLRWDVIMRNIIFAVGAAPGVVIRQTGDFFSPPINRFTYRSTAHMPGIASR